MAFSRSAHALLRTCADVKPRVDPDDPGRVLAMQIALNLPTDRPPRRADVLTDVARAVAALCLEPRQEWLEPLGGWYSARIRKVVRRSRNAAWRAVQELPGITVGSARAFVPGPVGEVPKAIRKLQVRGTDLPRTEQDPAGAGPVIAVDDGLGMTLGKAAAQVGHASMLLAAHRPEEWARRWVEKGYPVSVREVPAAEFARWAEGPGAVSVVDAGFTEVPSGSATAVACEVPQRS